MIQKLQIDIQFVCTMLDSCFHAWWFYGIWYQYIEHWMRDWSSGAQL